MISEAPCCGGGLSGNCVVIIHFIFWFLRTVTYWSDFELNEILARYSRKRVEIKEKNNAFSQLLP